MNKHDVNARIIRWLLLLEQFDLTIVDKAWKDNVVVDFLSRLTLPIGKEEIIDARLLDEHIFPISTLSPWFVDIGNYFVVGRLPPNLSSREKARLLGRVPHSPGLGETFLDWGQIKS